MMQHYMNGQWVREDKLVLPITDLSVSRGYGAFDFLRTYNKKPFHLHDHIQRLAKSAEYLHLTLPASLEEIMTLVQETIDRNQDQFEEAEIKILLSGGMSKDGKTPGESTFIIYINKASVFPKEMFQNGIKVIRLSSMRHMPQAKSLSYLAGLLGLQEARQQGAEEALYTDSAGRIYEGVTCNFFVVIDNKLKTAKEEVLRGITRKVVIELAKQNSIDVVEGPVTAQDLSRASEAFVTASIREVMPVVQVDNIKIGDGKPGPISKKLLSDFRDYAHKHTTNS